MKVLRIILPISIIFLLLCLIAEGCAYVNLMVSEKYETEVAGIPDANKEKAKIRKVEIEQDKKKTKKESVIIGILIIVILFVCLRLNANDNHSPPPFDGAKN